MKYFLLRDDIDFRNRWYLGDIRHVDNWGFICPTPFFMEPSLYTLDVFQTGDPMDFTLTEAYGVPILSQKAKDSLSGLPEIDEPYYHTVLEPVKIEGIKVDQDYYLMVVETLIDCVDETYSDFQKFEENDPVRPDKAGQYRAFFNLVIDPTKTSNRHIFRLENGSDILIVSEEVKRRFDVAGVTGAIFESVNGDKRTIA